MLLLLLLLLMMLLFLMLLLLLLLSFCVTIVVEEPAEKSLSALICRDVVDDEDDEEDDAIDDDDSNNNDDAADCLRPSDGSRVPASCNQLDMLFLRVCSKKSPVPCIIFAPPVKSTSMPRSALTNLVPDTKPTCTVLLGLKMKQ